MNRTETMAVGTLAEDIKAFARALGKRLDAEQVLLFGSHAEGRAGRGSDVDILVIAESALSPLKRLQHLYASAPGRNFPVDLLWYTPGEIAQHRGQQLTLVGRILEEGRVLYDRAE